MNDKMTVAEVVDALASATAWSKTLSRQFLNQLTDVIVAGLEQDGEVRVRGLGLFRSRRVEERMGRNPRTGEALVIPAHYKVQFLPEKSLRELVNRRFAHLKPEWLKERAKERAKETPIDTLPLIPSPSDVQTPAKRKSPSPAWFLLILGVIPLLWCLLRSAGFIGAPADKVVTTPPQAVVERPAKIVAPVAPAPGIRSIPAGLSAITAHEVKAGETLWGLSADFYREPLFWPLIYYHNRAVVTDPDIIEIGQVLQLQPLGGTSERLAGNDSLLLGQAFQAVAQVYRSKGKSSADSYQRVASQFGL